MYMTTPGDPGLPAFFRCHVERDGDFARVAPVGELDLVTAPRLDEELARACGDGVQRVVLDLRGLEFIDSTGIRLALRWTERAAGDGFAFEIHPGGRAVQRVFELAGLTDALPFRQG